MQVLSFCAIKFFFLGPSWILQKTYKQNLFISIVKDLIVIIQLTLYHNMTSVTENLTLTYFIIYFICLYRFVDLLSSLFFFPIHCPRIVMTTTTLSDNNWSPWFSLPTRGCSYVTAVYSAVVCNFLFISLLQSVSVLSVFCTNLGK